MKMKKRSIVTGWLCSYVIILMIPVVAIFINYAWSIRIIRNEIFQANHLVLDNLGDEIDRYLNREVSLYSYLMQEKVFVNVISSRKKDAQFYYDVAALSATIRKYDQEMSFTIYLRELDYVIGNAGANESVYYYNGMKLPFSDVALYEEWMEALSGEYMDDFFLGRYFHHRTDKTCLVYGNSVNRYAQYEAFNLFLGIPVSALEELTRSLSDGSVLLVGINGETALALSNQGISNVPDGQEPVWGVSSLTETREYMELRKGSFRSDVEYCLMIPKDEFWRELKQARNVLFLSVAVTLLVGIFCVSFILDRNFKPVGLLIRKLAGDTDPGKGLFGMWRGKGKSGKRKVNEYKFIEDAYFRLMGEKNTMYRYIVTQEERMQGSYLLAMMKGRAINTMENRIQLQNGQKMALAGFKVPLMDEKQFLQDEVMLFAVDNIFSELMEGHTFYRIDDGQYLFYLFFAEEEKKAWKGQLMKAAEYLCSFIKERLGISVCGAVSSMIDEPGQLRFIYQDVMEGLRSVELLKKSGVVDIDGRDETGGSGIVQSILAYVEAHFEDSDLNISTIAEEIDRNPKYISRVFKEETGEGILDYVNRLRIRKAQVLIRSGEFTLEQISGMVGYASSKTFRRAFRKETGMTPGNFVANPPGL